MKSLAWTPLLLLAVASPAAAQFDEPADDPGLGAEPVDQAPPFEGEDEPLAEDEGPVIDMPEEQTPPPSASSGRTAEVDMMRGLQEERFERADSTSIGGYGELHYNLEIPENGDSEAQLDLHRLVIFFAHNFSDDFRFYSEVEIEHAFIEGGDESGEVGVEQAYVDWRLLDDALGLRAGVVLVPMGIINQWHEPPIFNGVERPMVDKVIIPTTWREAGIGVFGQPTEGLRYELYLVGGLDPTGFSTGSGLRGGRQHVFEAAADGPALTGRIEWEPMLGMVAGLSGYGGIAGPNATLETNCTPDPMDPDVFNCTDEVDASIPVVGGSADVRIRWQGIEARALAAFFSIGDTDEIRTGDPDSIDVGSALFGWYVEAGYDVLNTMDTDQQLVPFARFEQYDTTFGHDQDAVEGSAAVTDVVLGLSYRPIPQLAFKGDVILRNPETGDSATLVDLGVGWMF